MHVFVSYSNQDADLAESVAIRLHDAGHEVFFDRSEIGAGEAFDAVIRDALARTDFLIFIASPEALADDSYSLSELSQFKRRFRSPQGRLLTVPIRGTNVNNLPAYLRAVSIQEVKGDAPTEITTTTIECLGRLRQTHSPKSIVVSLALVVLVCGTFVLDKDPQEDSDHTPLPRTRDVSQETSDLISMLNTRAESVMRGLDNEMSELQRTGVLPGLLLLSDAVGDIDIETISKRREMVEYRAEILAELAAIKSLFIELHKKNILALKNGDLTLSHEFTSQIHYLLHSRRLASEHVPGTMYAQDSLKVAYVAMDYPGLPSPDDHSMNAIFPAEGWEAENGNWMRMKRMNDQIDEKLGRESLF